MITNGRLISKTLEMSWEQWLKVRSSAALIPNDL